MPLTQDAPGGVDRVRPGSGYGGPVEDDRWPSELDSWDDDAPREPRPWWPRVLAVIVAVALLMSMTGWLLFSSGLLAM